MPYIPSPFSATYKEELARLSVEADAELANFVTEWSHDELTDTSDEEYEFDDFAEPIPTLGCPCGDHLSQEGDDMIWDQFGEPEHEEEEDADLNIDPENQVIDLDQVASVIDLDEVPDAIDLTSDEPTTQKQWLEEMIGSDMDPDYHPSSSSSDSEF
jgi:hypothetical protein